MINQKKQIFTAEARRRREKIKVWFVFFELCEILVLFLEKYTSNHYKMFSKQSEYDYFSTTTQFFTLKNVNNFIDCNSFDYDAFSLEFNKIEQQRVFTLVKIHLQKRNKGITQKSKQIIIYVCTSKPVKYTGAFIAITFILVRYFATGALAAPIPINPNQGSESVGVAASGDPRAPRGRPLALNAPYFKKGNLENLGVQTAQGKTEIISEGVRYFEQVPRPEKKKSLLTEIREKTKSAVKSAAECFIEPRPSDASSDVISSVPVIQGNVRFYTTKCKIANGRLYNETSKKYVVKSEFDNMIQPNSFVVFGEKTYCTERTIYRAEIKSETLGDLKNQKYFVTFYPRGEKGYIVTVCGNIGQSNELKTVAAKVQKALETDIKALSDKKDEKAKQAYYVYGGMTFEHGVPDLYSEVLGIGRTDRSNTNDSSYGLSIGDSLNKRMGKNQPSWADIYDLNASIIFNEREAKNFCNFFLEEFLNESVNLGKESTQRRCNQQIAEKLNKISKDVEKKIQKETYATLSPKQQVEAVHKACHEGVVKMLLNYNVEDSKEFQKNAFFDRDMFSLYAENYRIVHEFYCKKTRRYASELGVKPTQVSVCFFLDVCLLESQNNLKTEFKSMEYEQPVASITKLACPIENSVQNLQRAADISEAAELICKHAELTWPNDPALQKALKTRKQKLSFINAEFSSRAKTNFDMVKNLNSDSFRVYTKQKRPVSVSTKVEEEKVSVSLKVDTNEKVSVSLQVGKISMKLNIDENTEVPVELTESNFQQKSIDNRDEYIRPLKKKLNLFNNKCEQSENHLNSFSEANEGETDFGFITPENKTLNSDQTHDFLFRTGKISLNNSLQISQPCKATHFVDSFWSENQNTNSYNYSQANDTLIPTAVRGGTRT